MAQVLNSVFNNFSAHVAPETSHCTKAGQKAKETKENIVRLGTEWNNCAWKACFVGHWVNNDVYSMNSFICTHQ